MIVTRIVTSSSSSSSSSSSHQIFVQIVQHVRERLGGGECSECSEVLLLLAVLVGVAVVFHLLRHLLNNNNKVVVEGIVVNLHHVHQVLDVNPAREVAAF